MTEKSPASSIHSTEPMMTSASFDGGDAGPAADDSGTGAVDATTSGITDADASSTAAAAAVESSQLPPVMSTAAAATTDEMQAASEGDGDVEKPKQLSTLKELTVVSLSSYAGSVQMLWLIDSVTLHVGL